MGDGKFLGWLQNNQGWLGQTASNLIGSIGSNQTESQNDLNVVEKGKKTDQSQNTMLYLIGGVVLVLFLFMRKK
jgi:hypothetical protein